MIAEYPLKDTTITTVPTDSEEVGSTEAPVETPAPAEPQQPTWVTTPCEPQTLYATTAVNVRVEPNTNCEVHGVLGKGNSVTKIGTVNDWTTVSISGTTYYVYSAYLSTEKPVVQTPQVQSNQPMKNHLTRSCGRFNGPSGVETYYNMPMGGVVRIMAKYGYKYTDFWIRQDGVKMLGNYVMVAADLRIHPRGSLVQTSLGTGIVADTGSFTTNGSGVAYDIACAW